MTLSQAVVRLLYRILPLALGAWYAPARLTGQARADQAALHAWDDSLTDIASLPDLAHYERLSHQGGSVAGLRPVLLMLRHGELAHDRSEIQRAVTAANWVASAHDSWAWPHYIIARGEAATAIGGWLPLIVSDDKDLVDNPAERVWTELRAALDRNPDSPVMRRWLITLLVAGGDRLLRDDQVAMLRREIARPVPDADALLVWGRYLRTERAYDSAVATFRAAIERGGDRSRLDLELARTLRAVHDTADARAAYWRGVQQLTPVGRELYHYDLAWIIGADSLAAFDRLPGDSVSWWLHRFWDERDAIAANIPGERLDEHLRRWDVAYARYRVRSPWNRRMYSRIDPFFDFAPCQHLDRDLYDLLWQLPPVHAGDLRDNEWLLDHRGIVYLRHGEPVGKVSSVESDPGPEDFTSGAPADLPDSSPIWSSWFMSGPPRAPVGGEIQSMAPLQQFSINESWLYLMDGELRMLTFRGSQAIGMYDATTLSATLPYDLADWLARSGMTPEFHQAGMRAEAESHRKQLPRDFPSCRDEVRAATAKMRVDAEAGIHNDTDAPPLFNRWPNSIRSFALGDGRDQSGEALVTFAVAGDSLKAGQSADGAEWTYAVHFRVVAWEQQSGRTVTIDTVRTFVRRQPFAPGEWLVSWLELPLGAGSWELGIRATQGENAGAYAVRRDLHLDIGDTLALSDIVTGLPGAPAWRAPDGDLFPVNTLDAWPTGSSAELYFEVHGVPSGADYRTTVELRPLAGAKQQGIQVASAGRSVGATNRLRRTLDLPSLAAGAYQLVVTVEYGGRKATRSQKVTLIAPH